MFERFGLAKKFKSYANSNTPIQNRACKLPETYHPCSNISSSTGNYQVVS